MARTSFSSTGLRSAQAKVSIAALPTSVARTNSSNQFSVAQSFLNQTSFNWSSGGSPKVIVPVGSSLGGSNQFGDMLAGWNFLYDPTAGTLHTVLADWAWSGKSQREITRSVTVGQLDDPPDLDFRRFGPANGAPYASGLGTAAANLTPFTSVAVTNSNTASLALFKIGHRLVANGIPLGTTITSVSVVGTTATLGLSAPCVIANGTVVLGVGTVADLTGIGVGTLFGEVRGTPTVCPNGGDETTPGTPGAISGGLQIGFRTAELPRDLTGHQDLAQGCDINIYTTRNGSGFLDLTSRITNLGNYQIGRAAVGGTDGDKIQIRSDAGQNEVQQITPSSTPPSGGTWDLSLWPDPPANGYATAVNITGIAYNVSVATLQTAIDALAAPFGTGQIVVSGGPLPGTAITLTYSGASVTNHHYARCTVSNTNLTGGTYSSSTTTTGLASESANRLLYGRRSAANPTGDYFAFQDSGQNNVAVLSASGVLNVPGGVVAPGPLKPSAATVENYPRMFMRDNSVAAPTSGTMLFTPIVLPAGLVVNSITYFSGSTAASGPTHQWFALYDKNLNKLAVTADGTSGAWASNSAKTLPVSGGFTIPTSDIYLVAVVVTVSTTVPNFSGLLTLSTSTNLAPVYNGQSTAGRGDPTTAPSTAAAISATTGTPYIYVG